MAHPKPVAQMSYANYLAFERQSATKHEYLRGEVLAMAGGTLEYGRLASRISRLIGAGLGARPCETFSPDARVRVDATDLSTYPDVTVICGKLERSPIDPEAATNPTLLVEVLSESSEAYDRGEKFAHYRRIASLREYVLVSQETRHIEVFRRTPMDTWELFEAGPGSQVTFESLGVELLVDEVFRTSLEP